MATIVSVDAYVGTVILSSEPKCLLCQLLMPAHSVIGKDTAYHWPVTVEKQALSVLACGLCDVQAG